jgi:hypothetical protein
MKPYPHFFQALSTSHLLNFSTLSSSTPAPSQNMSVDVYQLPDNHFHTNNTETECSICHSADAADVPESSHPNVPRTSIIQLQACSHIFHEACIKTWLSTQFPSHHTTCAMCRHVLINKPAPSPTPHIDVRSAQIAALREEFDAAYGAAGFFPDGTPWSPEVEDLTRRLDEVEHDLAHVLRVRAEMEESS